MGLFQPELCIEFDLNLSGFGKLKLYFCGEANRYRKSFLGCDLADQVIITAVIT